MSDGEYAELNKQDIAFLYKQKSDEIGIAPHDAFLQYLDETMEDNEALEIVIQGNDKHNFNNRVNDKILIALCATLDQYAIYIEDIDLRFNEITDEGAQALADLISKSQRLLGLNLQGNKIKSEGAQFLAEALKECTNL